MIGLTSFLHKAEEIIEKFFPLWVITQFVQLKKDKQKDLVRKKANYQIKK